MFEMMRRVDRGWARFEGWTTVLVLILMVLVAGFAALVRNLTRFDIGWANALLNDMDWADSLLRKGTMWLAFLGASLATYHGKHINIDMILRIVPTRVRFMMTCFSSLVGSAITIALVISFSAAVYLNLTERPIEYELLGATGKSVHVCDATDEEMKQAPELQRPSIFCLSRTVLSVISIPAETPGAAFQLIVPVMMVVMALRLLGTAIRHGAVAFGSAEAIALAEEEERRIAKAQQEADDARNAQARI